MINKMARYSTSKNFNWIQEKNKLFIIVAVILLEIVQINCDNEFPSACEHLRSAEFRRAKSLGDTGRSVRIPRCSKSGSFEPIQCSNELNGTECWCVDEYGVEIMGSRRDNENDVNCTVAEKGCQASSCRMYCPSGFSRDLKTGCQICQCRDPCAGIECPGGLACQPQEVKCKTEPCPPIPTCKKARSLSDLCPAGQPLSISETTRPFLCGTDPGKPSCPALYQCLVQTGNDYGVCCPASLKIQKPGTCPDAEDVDSSDSTGFMCGTPCGHDLECPHMQKCCYSNGCGSNCRQPFNVTACHQAKVLSEILSVNEREGRGYVPQCDESNGMFSIRQCSRNGLVCWCVDPSTGNKIKGSMGAANMINCGDIDISNSISRSNGRSFDTQCDTNICAAVCEYGFKNDHNGCPTCECSEPCEGFTCPLGSHCEVVKDPECMSGSSLCASEPICQLDIVYSNPCDIGTPLSDNMTSEVFYCRQDIDRSAENNRARSFFDDVEEPNGNGRAMNNFINCPLDYVCKKLHGDAKSVCCPDPQESIVSEDNTERQQTMCEYLRDFSEKMEGTEEGMTLAISSPICDKEGSYTPMQCHKKKIKVTKSENKKIQEEKNIRQMRKLLASTTTPITNDRQKRNVNTENKIENVRLYRIDGPTIRSNTEVSNVVDFLKQKLANPLNSDEEMMIAEILSSRMFENSPAVSDVESRHAKLIDFTSSNLQNINLERGRPFSKIKIPEDRERIANINSNELIEVEVEECWCVDGFGTEIPKTKGINTTEDTCNKLRETLECLDLTCRMGCDYGFILDPDSQCPSCECRDPCDGVSCSEGQECRTVEVSCEGEYCPPVPACLPRKPGQCPFLVPPGNDGSSSDFCDYECRSDYHCEGDMRCCSNGCGTQCVSPQLKTACQHLQTIQIHQTVELGIPAKQKYIAQCDEKDGTWKSVQCGPDGICWCVDELGNEKSGTRNTKEAINCNIDVKIECPFYKCQPCENGYLLDDKGCRTCECRNPCKDISCPGGEICELVQIECTDSPCPKMPICVPFRDSICTEGNPLKLNGRETSCGPQNDADQCPSTHSCQLNPMTNKGVCCPKTRDVCFESLNETCYTKSSKNFENINKTTENIVRWKFSPRQNKCISILIPAISSNSCQSKNLFHSEIACNSVCPVLSQCERLRLKNMLAAKRAGQGVAWFSPRCDPETGLWSAVQCLGQTPKDSQNELSKSLDGNLNVCWCADKKGAPMKGSLTRGNEPKCNHRQARRRMGSDDLDGYVSDPVMEELIRQMTLLSDNDNFEERIDEENIEELNDEKFVEKQATFISTATEKILDRVNLLEKNSINPSEEKKLVRTTTRCNALKSTATFPVACDENGSFLPTQCNGDTCWCVDSAGNQLSFSSTFRPGSIKCIYTPIDTVEIELHLNNPRKIALKDVYDVLKYEIRNLLGNNPENFRVHENIDGNILLRFDLTDDHKIDTAFALEEMVKQNHLQLYNNNLVPDITQSRFLHRNSNLPQPQRSIGIAENTFHMIIFVIATGSAFLVSIFVVFIMLKRGRTNKMSPNKIIGNGDKYLDYSSPIFVLSANDKNVHEKFHQIDRNLN